MVRSVGNGAPDLILHSGHVYTVDPLDRVAEAVAIQGSRIAAVGSSADIRAQASSNTRQIDLEGRAVVPGFIDGHPHLDTQGLKLRRPSFAGATSIEEVLGVLTREVERRPAGEWIVCNPLAEEPDAFRLPNLFREGRWPDRRDLDRVAPQNPVYIPPPILVAPGVALANSAALRLTGITRGTTPPEGVEIETDATGEPTGIFRDSTFPKTVERALFPGLPRVTHAEMIEGVRAGMRAFNAAGVTAVYEGHGIPPEPQRAYLELWNQGALTVRTYFVVQYPTSLFGNRRDGDALIRETARYAAGAGFGDDFLKFGGLGFSVDSASAIGASLMREPYIGARGQRWHGIQHMSDEHLRATLVSAARANLRLQVQAAGGAAIDKVLAIFEELDREMPIAGKRWVIEHCQFPSAGNIETCRRLGVIPTTTTNFLWLHGSVYVKCFGRELAEAAVPLTAWLDGGVPVVQSTDGRPYAPLFAFWQSLARRDGLTGETLAGSGRKLSRTEALRIYTANGAYATFWEDRLGSIEPGKLADLVVLSDDIMTIPEDKIPDATVLSTLVGGQIVHDVGVFGK